MTFEDHHSDVDHAVELQALDVLDTIFNTHNKGSFELLHCLAQIGNESTLRNCASPKQEWETEPMGRKRMSISRILGSTMSGMSTSEHDYLGWYGRYPLHGSLPQPLSGAPSICRSGYYPVSSGRIFGRSRGLENHEYMNWLNALLHSKSPLHMMIKYTYSSGTPREYRLFGSWRALRAFSMLLRSPVGARIHHQCVRLCDVFSRRALSRRASMLNRLKAPAPSKKVLTTQSSHTRLPVGTV